MSDSKTLKKLIERDDLKSTLWSLVFTKNFEKLITVGSSKYVQVYKYSSMPPYIEAEDVITTQHNKSIRSIAVSPDNNLLAMSSFDASVSIWLNDGDLFDCVSILEGHESEVKCIDWHPTSNLLATCGRDKSIWIWEYSDLFEFYCLCIINAHEQDVKFIKWVPERDLLVSCSYDDSIRVWKKDETDDDDEYYATQTIKEHKSTVWAVDFSQDGELMFSCSEDGSIVMYKYKGGDAFEKIKTIEQAHSRPVYTICYDSINSLLFSVR